MPSPPGGLSHTATVSLPLFGPIQKEAENRDQILFANFTHDKAEKLIQELSPLLPKSLQKFFFSDNGSTAVEVALKMAVQSFAQRGEAQRKTFLSFKSSYHGDTAGAMSVSARGVFTKAYKSFLFPVISCSQGRFSFDPDEKFYQDFERKIEKHRKSLAGVIIEPLIQGAGGMIIWPLPALERICRLSKEAGAYLIFDEIMTGFGRTGTLFAFEQIKTKPDILCLSKRLDGRFFAFGSDGKRQLPLQRLFILKKRDSFASRPQFYRQPSGLRLRFGKLKTS